MRNCVGAEMLLAVVVLCISALPTVRFSATVYEVPARWGAREVLAYQPGQEQQRAPRPVVAHDVLRLPSVVSGDDDDVPERLAVDPRGVVLEEALVAVRTGEVELLAVIQRTNVEQQGPHCLDSLHGAV